MYIRRTRFDDLDDKLEAWSKNVNWPVVIDKVSAPLIALARFYINAMDRISGFVGIIAMYLLLMLMGILLYSVATNAFNHPVIWVMEMSQFTMGAYYILGGASSLKQGAHVRMDFLYERWSPKKKAIVDSFTIFFVIFFLVVLVKGGYDSSMFALEFDQRNHTVWRPPMAPIKIIMTFGMFLMLMQTFAEFLKDICRILGRKF